MTTEAPRITVVNTPNPHALMYRVRETLVPAGTYEYTTLEEAKDAPLGQALLAMTEVELILVAPRFITVRKQADADWMTLSPRVLAALEHFLDSGEMAVFDSRSTGPTERTDIERRIIELLDEEIRPALAQDGGDVTFEAFVDGVVQLRLIGACGTCPSSTYTLKAGIERLLMEEIPEVQGVENLT
jgi:Fe-S cluster biogenesis protein NfuA